MIPDNLMQQTENQEKELISFNIELCEKVKKSTEDQFAEFILKKDIYPVTRWYIVDKEDREINLDVGDRIDHIELAQCFNLKNKYLGTIRSIIVELGPKHIKLATPEKYYYLMGEGNKIFGIYKPFAPNSEDDSKEKIQKITSIVILLFILILIISGFLII